MALLTSNLITFNMSDFHRFQELMDEFTGLNVTEVNESVNGFLGQLESKIVIKNVNYVDLVN